ncbi:MAG: aminotransferase class I/II-fold pyridoxal phosphate-dependent enzyme [Planctomycetes bacterium]|nr:aminotransferase class I/II-fold pyridoxal phosphate-dependent enzyme [Planctomycetota bacterium]
MREHDMASWSDATICEHAFENNAEYFNAVAPPIIQTTLFTFPSHADYVRAAAFENDYHIYTRGLNPTTEILGKKMAALERGERAKAFSSGMGAISAVLSSLLQSGDHVLLVNNVYGPTAAYCRALAKFGIETDTVFADEAGQVEAALKGNTKIICYESPSTQMMHMLDVDQIAAIARKHGVLTMTDNTWATPLYQKPLTRGIDISVHSCTKYIGGHSDTVGGVVISSADIIDRVFTFGHQFHGACLGPMEAWLLIRGLRTLQARLALQQTATRAVVAMLEAHPKVRAVHHPFSFTGDQKRLAEKYLTGYTSLLSFELDTRDPALVSKVVDACRLFRIGVSWGGHESLILPQYNGKNLDQLRASHIPPELIRVYVGLESADDLVPDLEAARDGL